MYVSRQRTVAVLTVLSHSALVIPNACSHQLQTCVNVWKEHVSDPHGLRYNSFVGRLWAASFSQRIVQQ